jgi:RNA recognition motif-containing protein
MYGFVTMATHPEAAIVAEKFNNTLFMGRTMK